MHTKLSHKLPRCAYVGNPGLFNRHINACNKCLDLSAAFDMINIDLLLKRMKIMGLPDDLTDLISVWLRDRSVSEWKNQSGLVKGNFR